MTKLSPIDALPLIAGLLASIYSQTLTGWWLNSGRGVAYTEGALFASAAVVGAVGRGLPLTRLVALWLGAQIGLAGWMFAKEGLSLFPIVMVLGAGMTACAVAAGGGVGWLISRVGHSVD